VGPDVLKSVAYKMRFVLRERKREREEAFYINSLQHEFGLHAIYAIIDR